jgi:hypothetical protein
MTSAFAVAWAAAHVLERAAFRHDRERDLASHRLRELVEARERDSTLRFRALHLLHGCARDAGARGKLRLREAEAVRISRTQPMRGIASAFMRERTSSSS